MSDDLLYGIFIFLGVVTFALSIYLGILFRALKHKKIEFELYKNKMEKELSEKENYVVESLRIIALAVTQDQCEISEGVVRIKKLLDETLFLKDEPTLHDFHRIYDLFKEFPYLTKREELTKQERFHQDKKRFKIEEENAHRVKNLCFELLALIKKDTVLN